MRPPTTTTTEARKRKHTASVDPCCGPSSIKNNTTTNEPSPLLMKLKSLADRQLLQRGQRSTATSSNLFNKLNRRELTHAGNLSLKKNEAVSGKFKNFRLQQSFDAYEDINNRQDLKLPFIKRRAKVTELIVASGIIFSLTQSGVCACFSRDANKKICYLNTHSEEVIRSLFFNKINQSIIVVSVFRSDNFSSLKCRTIPLEYIKRGKPELGYSLFDSESLKWPGFVEFDDVNGKVLTYSSTDQIYRIWDLANYNQLYSIQDNDIQEIKISPGIMLVIYNRNTSKSCVPLKILSINDGKELLSFEYPLDRAKKIDFIEQFNEKLLVKQEDHNLQILDIQNMSRAEISQTKFITPQAFIFLYENQLFLTFRDSTVSVWNFKGELTTKFEDDMLWTDCNTNTMYITSQQDLIISYCRESPNTTASINVSSILTGKCIARITEPKDATKQCLQDVTALFYDEERNEIYTGNESGMVHCWTN